MLIDKVLKYLSLSALFLLPFIPFLIADSMFFPFITGKNIAFRILVEIAVGMWLILAIRNGQYRIRWTILHTALLIFVAVIFLSDIFGVNFTRSFWSNFERMEGFVTILHFAGLFFVTTGMFRKIEDWRRFLNTSVFASMLMGIYALFQIGGVLRINQGGVRVDGTFGNATYMAVYMLMHIFITLLLLFWYRRHKLLTVVYVVAVALQGIVLWYTATRGAILGLFGGLLLSVILVALFEKEK